MFSKEKVFWKYAANLQENTHAKVRFQLTVANSATAASDFS